MVSALCMHKEEADLRLKHELQMDCRNQLYHTRLLGAQSLELEGNADGSGPDGTDGERGTGGQRARKEIQITDQFERRRLEQRKGSGVEGGDSPETLEPPTVLIWELWATCRSAPLTKF